MKGTHWVVILIFLVMAAYLVNFPFSFVPIPDAITQLESWIVFVGGLFVVYGAYNYYLRMKNVYG